MKTFAFLTHPANIQQVRNIWPLARLIPGFAIESFLKITPFFKVSEIKNIRSSLGKEINGFLINTPLLFNQLLGMNEQHIQDKIVAAIDIAYKLGAEILGLDGLFAEMKFKAGTRFKLPITCGDTFAAWTIVEAVYRVAKIKKIDLKQARVSVIGATSLAGSLSARRLAQCVSSITVSGKKLSELEKLKAMIENGPIANNFSVNIEQDALKAIKNADIVVMAAVCNDFPIHKDEVKSGAIVCGISLNNNIRTQVKNAQKGTIAIEGGLVRLPYPVKFTINPGLPKNLVSARLAETMLLTFEEKQISRNVNDNTNLSKLEEIANIAVRHGFETWVPDAPAI